MPVFQEYEAVLKRKKSLSDFKLNIRDINKILTFVAHKGSVFDNVTKKIQKRKVHDWDKI